MAITKSRTSAVVDHFAPKLASALQTKTAADIKAVLVPTAVAAWVAGVQHAAKAAPAIASGVSDSGLDLGAPANADPAWAETASLDDLPDALSARVDDLADYADNLSSFDSPLEAGDQADLVAASMAAGVAETSAQAAYAAGGVSQWDFILDSEDACQACHDAADGSPYDVGDGPELPVHDRCGCESSPEVDSSEARSGRPNSHKRRVRMAATPVHHTETSDATWDGPAQVSNLETPLTTAVGDDTFAWVDPDKDETTKSAWKFPHHFVSNNEPGKASTVACSAVVAALNGGRGGTTIPDADRQAVYKHVVAHLKDSGVEDDDLPELKSAEQLEEEDRADGDGCNRCDGEGTIDLNGTDIMCPQCGGSGAGDNNSEEQNARPKVPAAAYRSEMRNVPESRVSTRSAFELREVPNGTGGTNLRFTGFASVTGDAAAYEMEDWYGPWVESVSIGAFTKTLSEGADVAFLLNHEGMTLARTKPGTLKLSEETEPNASPIYGITGLHSEAMLDPQNMYVQAMRSAVDRGDLDEMSFAFRVMRQEWNEDYTRRWINEVNIDKGDVSLVNYGANPTTGGTVGIRQRLQGRDRGGLISTDRLAHILRHSKLFTLSVDALTSELREGKVLSADNNAKIQQAMDALHAADDADITSIVRSLQDIDTALDEGMACLSYVLQVANPDGDPGDLEPELAPPGSESLDFSDYGRERARLEALRYGPRKGVA